MSITYIGAFLQFGVILGLITGEEAQTIGDGLVAISSLVLLLITLYGRFRLGGVDKLGFRK
jgi:hypothetical protein